MHERDQARSLSLRAAGGISSLVLSTDAEAAVAGVAKVCPCFSISVFQQSGNTFILAYNKILLHFQSLLVDNSGSLSKQWESQASKEVCPSKPALWERSHLLPLPLDLML